MRLRSTLACAITTTLLSLSAHAASAEGELRLSASTSLDTNARRDFLETGAEPDLVASALLAGQGRLSGSSAEAWGSYELGARKFARLSSEDSIVQSAGIEGSVGVLSWLRAGVDGRAKDRRGGERSYSELLGEGFLELRPDARVEVRVRAGAHRFIYWPALQYSFSAPELSTVARFRFDRRHSAFAYGELGLRGYNAAAYGPQVGTEPPPKLGQRRDVSLGGGVGYSYRGPFSLGFTYDYVEQDSNSFGESLARHRVALTAAVRLPFKLVLVLLLAYQVTRYPDGIYLSPEIKPLLEDDENHNEVSVRLVRPLSKHFDLELNYALFHNALPRNELTYLRQVVGVGIAYRL